MKTWCNIDIKDGITLMNEYWEYMDVDKVNNLCSDCTSRGICISLINCLREGHYGLSLSLKQSVYEEKEKGEVFKESTE